MLRTIMAFWNKKKTSAHAPTSAPTSAPTPHVHGPNCSHGTGAGAGAGSEAPRPTKPSQPRAAQPAALSGVRSVIAIASGKGGVGKSTVSTNLAVALRHTGASVGLMDADVYGPSQTGMMGAAGKQGTSTPDGQLIPAERHGVPFISMGLLMGDDRPLVWRAPMAMQVINQFLGNVRWGSLDYLLIDLPPGTGDVQLTLAQQARLAGAVIVTTPQEVALGIAKKGLEMFRQLNIPIFGIIENMSGFTCKHCGEETAIFKEGGGERLARELGVPFLGSIPLDPEIMLSGDEGIPVLEKGTTSVASQAFISIAAKVDQQARASGAKTDTLEPKEFSLAPNGELLIHWPDGHGSVIRPFTLRVNCGCASCIDENTGRPLLDPKRVALDIKIREVSQVGRYALTAAFSDGHSTGIYPFKKLRAICECPECAAQRTKTMGTPASFSV